MSTSSLPIEMTDIRGRGMNEYACLPTAASRPTLCGPDVACAHGDIAGGHVVADTPDAVTAAHAVPDLHALLTAVGPAQRHHRVGEGRHRGARLDPHSLARLCSQVGVRASRATRHRRRAVRRSVVHPLPGRRIPRRRDRSRRGLRRQLFGEGDVDRTQRRRRSQPGRTPARRSTTTSSAHMDLGPRKSPPAPASVPPPQRSKVR